MENKEEVFKKVKQYLDRFGELEPDNADEQAEIQGKQKLENFLSNPSVASEIKQTIQQFEQDEAQSRKLYNYCLDFNDLVSQTNLSSNDGEKYNSSLAYVSDGTEQEQVETVRYLDDDEIEKLRKFVAKHKSDKTFGDAAYEIMYKHNMTPPDVYKSGMISRQDWSRVTSYKCKGIKKTTVWNIIIGLHCDLDEAEYLLNSAGLYKRNTVFDLILEYMVITKNYDVMAINELLDMYGQPLLSCELHIGRKKNQK